MSRIFKISIVVMLAMVLVIPNIYAYKKVKAFIPEAPEIDLQGVNKIAVLDFKATGYANNEAGKYIADRMIEFLLMEDRGIHAVSGGFMRSNKEGRTLIEGLSTICFSVVERSRLDAVLDEQNMSDVGLVDDQQAAQIGQLLGAEILLYGDITHSKKDKKSKETRTKNKKKYFVNCVTREVVLNASLRIVDTKSGEIIGIKRLTKKASDKKCGNNIKNLKDVGFLAGQCGDALAWEFVNMINPWYAFNEFDLEKIKTDEFKKQAEVAAKAAEKLELDKAYAIYKKLYDSDPYNPKFLYNMGVLYEVAGEFALAKEMYESAAMLKDEKKYNKAVDRIGRRIFLVPFYASLEMAIVPFDFEAAVSNKSLTAKKIKVKGSSKDRVNVFSQPNKTSSVMVKVPGDVQFEVINTEGNWYFVKLLGGKEGYIHKENVEG